MNSIEAEPAAHPSTSPSQRIVSVRRIANRVSSAKVFESLAVLKAPAPVQQLARDLLEVARQYPETVGIDWGTGREGSMVLKRNDGSLIEVHGAGYIRFRPRKFRRALGDEVAQQYEDALKRLVPTAMAMSYPKLPESQAARNAAELLQTLRAALASVETQT